MQLDTLVVELLMKNADFLAQTKKVEAALNGLKGVAQAAGVAMAAMFIKSGVNQYVEQATAIKRLSESVRENTEDLQAWGEAVKREGGSAESFAATLKKVSTLGGVLRKPLDTLKALSGRFSKMSTVRSLALGKKIGLDEVTIRLLQKGRKGVEELIEKYKGLGVMSEQDVKNGERLNKVFQDYRQIVTFLGMRIAGYFLPIAEKLSTWFTKGTKWVKENERVFKAAIITIGSVMTTSLIKPLLKLISNPVLAGLAALAAAIMLIVEDFMAWKEGADSALAPVYEWLSEKIPQAMEALQPIIDGVSGVWEHLTEIFKDFLKWIFNLDEEWPELFKAFNQLSEWFNKLIPSGETIKKVFDGINIAIDTVIETIKTLFGWFNKLGEKAGAWVAEKLFGLSEPVKQMAQVQDQAPAIMNTQNNNRTSTSNDNSKNWKVDNVNVTNNFSTPVPQAMQAGVANGFSSSVLQMDRVVE